MKRVCIMMLIVMITGLSVVSAPAKSKPEKSPKQKKEKKLDINFATAEELQTRLGIDAETAQKVIENRPYQNKKDLNEVLELDKKEFAKLQRSIVVRRSTINFARQEELETLPGIDEETAQAIIDGRPYDTAEELLEIDGINEETLKTLDGFIQVKVNINDATPEDLQKLPGIDPVIAQAIIDASPYKMIEELLLIDGIDEGVLAELQEFIEARMNINTATQEDLQTLPGLTPDIAGAIIERRDTEGDYETVKELLLVDGIDEELLAGIEKHIFAVPGKRGKKLPGPGR